MSDLAGMVGVLAALIAVCGIAFLVLKLVQRMPGSIGAAGPQGSPLRLLRSVAVGQRERVTLVSYRGEVFMLGVAAGGVSLLARLDEEAAPDPSVAPNASPWLAERFRAAMQTAKAAPTVGEAPERQPSREEA